MTKTGLFVLFVTVFLIASFAWSLFGVPFVGAEEPRKCGTVEDVAKNIRADLAQYHPEIELLDAEQSAAFLLHFNREPPVSKITADSLMLISARGQEKMMMVVFKSECYAAVMWISRAVHDRVREAMGTPT